jgi:hypothetical protein
MKNSDILSDELLAAVQENSVNYNLLSDKNSSKD